MPESRINIPVEDGQIALEALYKEGRNGRNGLLCHPYPLYGGSMDNNVVLTARRAFQQNGWATLRFNFRGVGASGGISGEPDKDAEDVAAVAAYIRANYPGALDVAAYSYGAWTALRALRMGLVADTLILISPPLDFMSFSDLELPDLPVLITLGNQDEFCSAGQLRKWLAEQPRQSLAEFELFAYGDHFYAGMEGELVARVERFLKSVSEGGG
ncbi:MAG: alpha/beta fold hydrolase [Desulfobacteraceae bacterium]|nr:alpha/beta fold hydrolase [Desulfobacteraceae bacterium]